MMLARAIAVWLALMLVAILNGFLREALLIPWLGERAAHVASTLILCSLILFVAWLSIRWIRPRSHGEAWTVGLTWLLLTLAFEFLAGHYVFGYPWQRLLADYDLSRGRIWPLVLVASFAAPALAVRIRGRSE
ncbi:MAG: hypothetical protein KDB80_00960 [Planctomycetes bacterium]|nr:hypothetical protein [Planctomycetota bacterium]